MSTPVECIIILTETPLRERDYERFGVEVLAGKFEVLVLDFTALIHPQIWETLSHVRREFSGYRSVRTIEELSKIIRDFEGRAVAIDYLFFGAIQHHVRSVLRKEEIATAAVLAGLIPSNSFGRYGVGRFIAKKTRDIAFRSYCSFRSKVSRIVRHPEHIADIALLSGSYSLSLPRARAPHRIIGHSFDYDVFLKFKGSRGEARSLQKYIVFLDQDLVGHSDRLITGTRLCITPRKYFKSMNEFFSRLEDRLGIPVVIAGQPKALYPEDHPFWPRKIALNNSACLVKDAELIVAHYSTAISFGVLWRKPIFLLTTDELRGSWIQKYWIDAFQHELRVPLLNVDSLKEGLPVITSVTKETVSYCRYQERYIKMPGTPEMPLWQIFSEAVEQMSL